MGTGSVGRLKEIEWKTGYLAYCVAPLRVSICVFLFSFPPSGATEDTRVKRDEMEGELEGGAMETCPIFAAKDLHRDLIRVCFGWLGEIEVVLLPLLDTSAPFRTTAGVQLARGGHMATPRKERCIAR